MALLSSRSEREATALVSRGLGRQPRARANPLVSGDFYLLLPLIGNELGLSYRQIGSILTCQAAAGAISNIPGGCSSIPSAARAC